MRVRARSLTLGIKLYGDVVMVLDIEFVLEGIQGRRSCAGKT